MKGKYHVKLQNGSLRYEFDIKRNITVLKGDSATGKTTLIGMVQEYINNGEDSSIELRCDKYCYVLEGATWRGQLSEMKRGEYEEFNGSTSDISRRSILWRH